VAVAKIVAKIESRKRGELAGEKRRESREAASAWRNAIGALAAAAGSGWQAAARSSMRHLARQRRKSGSAAQPENKAKARRRQRKRRRRGGNGQLAWPANQLGLNAMAAAGVSAESCQLSMTALLSSMALGNQLNG